jgi:hypothetical protein
LLSYYNNNYEPHLQNVLKEEAEAEAKAKAKLLASWFI